jgi:hypothetical protein
MSWNPTARVIAYIYICTYIPTCTSESYRFVGSHLVLRKPLWKRVTSATYLHSFQSCLKSRKFHSWPSLSTLELWSDWTFFCQFLRPVINCVSMYKCLTITRHCLWKDRPLITAKVPKSNPRRNSILHQNSHFGKHRTTVHTYIQDTVNSKLS